MLLLGLLIGGPSTVALMYGFNQKLVSRHGPRAKVILDGFFERLGYAAGMIVSVALWGGLLVLPFAIFLANR
jgi:hypothetical protein